MTRSCGAVMVDSIAVIRPPLTDTSPCRTSKASFIVTIVPLRIRSDIQRTHGTSRRHEDNEDHETGLCQRLFETLRPLRVFVMIVDSGVGFSDRPAASAAATSSRDPPPLWW